MNPIARNTLALYALVLLGSRSTARAQYNTCFPKDTTIDYAIPNNAIVGYANDISFFRRWGGTSPTVNLVSGGSVFSILSAFNHSTVNINGGSVGFRLLAWDESTINVTDGNVGFDLTAENNSTINFSGSSGYVSLYAENSSMVNFSGGSIGFLLAQNNSTVNISDGIISTALYASDISRLNLVGTGLSDTLINPRFGRGTYSQYALSGTLADGTDLKGKLLNVQNGSNAKVTFNGNLAISSVPEPGSLALLVGIASVSVGILCKRRK